MIRTVKPPAHHRFSHLPCLRIRTQKQRAHQLAGGRQLGPVAAHAAQPQRIQQLHHRTTENIDELNRHVADINHRIRVANCAQSGNQAIPRHRTRQCDHQRHRHERTHHQPDRRTVLPNQQARHRHDQAQDAYGQHRAEQRPHQARRPGRHHQQHHRQHDVREQHVACDVDADNRGQYAQQPHARIDRAQHLVDRARLNRQRMTNLLEYAAEMPQVVFDEG